MIPMTITKSSISFVLDKRHRQLPSSAANFEPVKAALKRIQKGDHAALDDLRLLSDIPTFIATVSQGRVALNDSEVRIDGQKVHGHIAERLLTLLREGLDVTPWARFVDRLLANTVITERDDFLSWLEHSNFPITEDGCFIAYKFVNAQYRDAHTGKIDNRVGAVIPRLAPDSINTDRYQTCAASGYHFCSYDYLGSYLNGSHPIMIVKIAPEDVASFPPNEIAKGRCLFYEIIDEISQEDLRSRKIETGTVYNGMVEDPSPYQDEAPEVPEEDERDEDCSDFNEQDESDDESDDVSIDTVVMVVDAGFEGLGEKVAKAAAKPTGRQLWLERLRGRTYEDEPLSQKRLLKLIGKHGQREVSRRTGIPRATLQGWLK